jgi:hypothetical protein
MGELYIYLFSSILDPLQITNYPVPAENPFFTKFFDITCIITISHKS